MNRPTLNRDRVLDAPARLADQHGFGDLKLAMLILEIFVAELESSPMRSSL